MIGIRVDVNETIATGHFMRCLSIAQGIKDARGKVLFISADEKVQELCSRYQFTVEQLGTRWDDPNSELDTLADIIKQYNINKLLIDSYYVTEGYLRKLSDIVDLVYLDDINRFKYPVDTLINYNIFAHKFNYADIHKRTNTQLILGPEYAPLRNEFRNIDSQVKEAVKNVLITTGGSDPFGITEPLAKAIINLKDLSHLQIHVIAGRYSKLNVEQMTQLFPNIQIHQNAQNVSHLMQQCDIAVTAGGFTLYELCACGIPSVSFTFANNQILGAKTFDEMCLIPYSGDVRTGLEQCVSRILNMVRYYIDNYQVRKSRSERMQMLVDGLGVSRICREVFDI